MDFVPVLNSDSNMNDFLGSVCNPLPETIARVLFRQVSDYVKP
jgi:hypothetical protein